MADLDKERKEWEQKHKGQDYDEHINGLVDEEINEKYE